MMDERVRAPQQAPFEPKRTVVESYPTADRREEGATTVNGGAHSEYLPCRVSARVAGAMVSAVP
jgi:hypothetical protein